MEYYKVLAENGEPCNGGSGTYHLPTKNDDGTWTPGEWMPDIEGDLEPCENGYHLCRPQDLLHWLGPEIYEAECDGECVESNDKIVVRRARLLRRIETWNERRAREFACWCVRSTPIGDGKATWELLTDERSRRAVEVAELYARGEATDEELAAARAAAWDAARDAAWDAARAAAWAAARAAAWAAARDAAWAAASGAAWAAARDAAWAAARDAQAKHLFELLCEPQAALAATQPAEGEE